MESEHETPINRNSTDDSPIIPNSPTQDQADDTYTFDNWLFRHFGGIEIPDPLDVASVLTGDATPAQKLRVAAYVRDSVRGQHELALLLKEEMASSHQTIPAVISAWAEEFNVRLKAIAPWVRLREIIAQALPVAPGLRSVTDTESQMLVSSLTTMVEKIKTFHAPDEGIQVTVHIAPPQGEAWTIFGTVTQNRTVHATPKVKLSADQMRTRSRIPNAMGDFSFRRLPAGTYQLIVELNATVIRIPEILSLTE